VLGGGCHDHIQEEPISATLSVSSKLVHIVDGCFDGIQQIQVLGALI
jgi:hypothetical protein